MRNSISSHVPSLAGRNKCTISRPEKHKRVLLAAYILQNYTRVNYHLYFTLVKVAIAGGTGKLGQTIAEVLSLSSKHSVIILSRQATSPSKDYPTLPVNYEDIGDLAAKLDSESVHTVISTLQVNSPESGAREINLAQAASQSRTTKRFITSEWSIPVPDPNVHLPQQAIRNATIEALRALELEFTTVYNGFIMDSFGIPHIKSHMGPIGIHIDMHNRTASIPGDGDAKMMFSYSYDIARFVEAALDLPRWDEEMYCYSDLGTYNKVVELAEKSTGDKFTVTHDKAEDLEKGVMTELPCHEKVYARMPKNAAQRRFSMFGLYSIRGYFDKPEGKMVLNDLFPEVKTTSLAEIMGAWNNKS